MLMPKAPENLDNAAYTTEYNVRSTRKLVHVETVSISKTMQRAPYNKLWLRIRPPITPHGCGNCRAGRRRRSRNEPTPANATTNFRQHDLAGEQPLPLCPYLDVPCGAQPTRDIFW